MNNRITTDEDITVLALCKGNERYIILHDDARLCDVVTVLRDWSTDSRLSFTAYDANKMLLKMRQNAGERCMGR